MKNLKETIKEFGKIYINGGNGIAFDFYMTLNIEDAGLLDTIYDIVDELTLNDEWEEIEINNDDIEISTERQAEKITSEQQEQQEKEEKMKNIKNIYDVKEFIKREARELDNCYFEKDSDGDYYLTGEGVSELLDLAVHEFGFFDLVRIYQRNGLLEFEEAQKLLYDELFNNGVDWEEIEDLIYYDDIIDKMEELDSEEINQVLYLELWKWTEA